MSDTIRMTKSMVECFTKVVEFNGGPVEILYVPRFGNKPGWVGPGYWNPTERFGPAEPPLFKYNTHIYPREELIKAGAKSKFEYLWMR